MMQPVKRTNDIEADWSLKATQSAIDVARAVVTGDGINSRAMIGSLSDIEWGWIVTAVIFGWIETKSKQAVAEGLSCDTAILTMSGPNPQPWEAGAISSILPALGDLTGVDWNKPVGKWSKEEITRFAWQVYRLTDQALALRDEGAQDKIVRHLSQQQAERELSAANGGPLMSRQELNDPIPFL